MKDILAEHFDRSPVKTETCTQYYQGEYWGPKHQDSLAFLIERLEEDSSSSSSVAQRATEKIREAIETLESAESELDNEF